MWVWKNCIADIRNTSHKIDKAFHYLDIHIHDMTIGFEKNKNKQTTLPLSKAAHTITQMTKSWQGALLILSILYRNGRSDWYAKQNTKVITDPTCQFLSPIRVLCVEVCKVWKLPASYSLTYCICKQPRHQCFAKNNRKQEHYISS